MYHVRKTCMLLRITRILLLLVLSAVTLPGCKKDDPQKPAAMQAVSAPDSQAPGRDGETLFRQYCANCHPNGGNISDPKRTLHGPVLRKNHITRPEDIVRIMRNPLSRMIRFDPSTLSDRDALAIAEYILITFK